MQAIYTPKGKALEYCERAVNLYRGCGHGCGRGGEKQGRQYVLKKDLAKYL